MHKDSVARSKTRREVHHEADPKLQQSSQRVRNMLEPVHVGEERSMQRGIFPEDDGEHERDAQSEDARREVGFPQPLLPARMGGAK